MARPEHETRRDPDAAPPTSTRAPDRSPFTGIVVTIVAVILAVVAIAFIGGAFTSEDIGGDLDNAALEGPVAGANGGEGEAAAR